jgi:hypothetical protein
VDEEPRARRNRDVKVERTLEMIENLFEAGALGDAPTVGVKDVRSVGSAE